MLAFSGKLGQPPRRKAAQGTAEAANEVLLRLITMDIDAGLDVGYG
jgi:hypothetical protein